MDRAELARPAAPIPRDTAKASMARPMAIKTTSMGPKASPSALRSRLAGLCLQFGEAFRCGSLQAAGPTMPYGFVVECRAVNF